MWICRKKNQDSFPSKTKTKQKDPSLVQIATSDNYSFNCISATTRMFNTGSIAVQLSVQCKHWFNCISIITQMYSRSSRAIRSKARNIIEQTNQTRKNQKQIQHSEALDQDFRNRYLASWFHIFMEYSYHSNNDTSASVDLHRKKIKIRSPVKPNQIKRMHLFYRLQRVVNR